MAIPPADLGDHDAKLPILEAEVEPIAIGDGPQQMPESSGEQPSPSEMHEVEALFEANRHAACRVEQVLITVRPAGSVAMHEHSDLDVFPPRADLASPCPNCLPRNQQAKLALCP